MTVSERELAISIVIPTHNPRTDYLRRVLEALRGQTLAKDLWELIVVDNGSRVPLKVGAVKGGKVERCESNDADDCIDLSWQLNARIVREEELGLTFARLRGFAEAKGELIVMVDDDNVLAADYLENAISIAQRNPALGAFGGKCLPEFEVEPEAWLASVTSGLGLRDRGEREEVFPEAEIAQSGQLAVGSWQGEENRRLNTEDCKLRLTELPDCAPIGAGMVLRRKAAAAYAERIKQRTTGSASANGYGVTSMTITDRKGDSLASGGDNDICLTVLEEGWQVGYLPQLQLTHLIPKRRMTLDYHRRMAREAMRSFVLMLDQHGIRPWSAVPAWSVPLRVANDYVRVQPWKGPERLLKWCMNRGRYEACGKLAESGRAAD